MEALLQELIPHAPQMGLHLAPNIPPGKLENALRDYARSVHRDEVLALYDATLMGGARDGAVFCADRFVFQNNDLQEAQEVRYSDLVRVEEKRKFFGGQKVLLSINRGRSTFELEMDFSGKPGAAEYVARFLSEALLRGSEGGAPPPEQAAETDVGAVRAALDALRTEGQLAEADYRRLLAVLGSEAD